MSDETSLLDTFDTFREALFANDLRMLNLLMAVEYVGFDPLGNMQDKSMTLNAYQPSVVKLDRYDVEEMKSVVIGEVGIITGKGYIHGHYQKSEFEHRVRFLDLYIHRDGRWQLYMSQVTPLGKE